MPPPPCRLEAGTWVDKYSANKNIPLLFGEPTQMRYIRQHTQYQKKKEAKIHRKGKNSAVRTMSTDFSFSGNELCCTVLFTLSSYQSQNSTETANWKGQPGTVCSLSRLDVYRRQNNFFINQDKNAGRLPDSPHKNVHVHASMPAWMSISVERCQADAGLQTETMTREPLAPQMKHLGAKVPFLVGKLDYYALLRELCSITIYQSY